MTEQPVATYSIAASLRAWAGKENLEERVDGIEQIDPIVLGILREATG
jgi:Putative peptidoglycan binding domain